MTTQARIRPDLVAQGLQPATLVPNGNDCYVSSTVPLELLESTFLSVQPEEWDGMEFNTVLIEPHSMDIFRINSIDCEFFTEKE